MLCSSRWGLKRLALPFLGLLPHAALRKMIIVYFLRPLKPLQLPVADACGVGCGVGDGNGIGIGDDPQDDLCGAFTNSEPPPDQRMHRRRHQQQSAAAAAANGAAARQESGVVIKPRESLAVKNSKEFLIAQLDDLAAAELAARLA